MGSSLPGFGVRWLYWNASRNRYVEAVDLGLSPTVFREIWEHGGVFQADEFEIRGSAFG
jgi:hypothetical protein